MESNGVRLNKNTNLDYTNFNKDMSDFANKNNINSKTDYLIITSTKNKYTYIFEKNKEAWDMLYKWSCTVGKNSTPTISGVFFVGIKYPAIGDENSSVKYATNITDEYYYHSIIYNETGLSIKDDRLGVAISHGCIRLATSSAKWIYENVREESTIIIY
ncbi:L,D-transpeptidase [Romboutsia lituseburensis]|uniref:L,D-transpeptidase n=1 Tax=Romboutsia lituseburensis TaxID=1537 RepID=UPI00215A9C4B|nr:L,D-transpeptidase [Romboutsia lituseburensis]MCR8744090.1 L,D-transpeptidase [Romboutsia lituseburensis]